MGTPAAIQILDAIGLRLALPTTARGYNTTVAVVERARVIPFRDFDIPAVNYWADSEAVVDAGAGWSEHEVSIMIDARTHTRDRPFVDVAFELGTDLWIALWRAPAAPAVSDQPSMRLGGIVNSLAMASMVPAIGEGQSPFCGVLLSIIVKYRVRPTAPYTLIT